jgi:hypothetical protein
MKTYIKIKELIPEIWNQWITSRPKIIQELAEQFSPEYLYTLKTTGSRVYIYAYNEDGTMTVDVDPTYNADRIVDTMFPRRVFGIKREDLERIEKENIENAEEI